MGDDEREPRDVSTMRRVVVEQLISNRIAPPWGGVTLDTVRDWVPAHEEGVAIEAVMELLDEDTPVRYAKPGSTVQVCGLEAAQEYLDSLEPDYPRFFEDDTE